MVKLHKSQTSPGPPFLALSSIGFGYRDMKLTIQERVHVKNFDSNSSDLELVEKAIHIFFSFDTVL